MATPERTERDENLPVYTASQRMLRFISLVYLVWQLAIVALAIAAAAWRLLSGAPLLPMPLPASPLRTLLDLVVSLADTGLGLAFSLCGWMAANHPVIARRFRIFAAALVGVSVLSLAYAVAAGQAASVMSGLYSLIITGLVCYLAVHIAREERSGEAVDHARLAVTASGRHLRTDSQIARARRRGERILLPENATARTPAATGSHDTPDGADAEDLPTS